MSTNLEYELNYFMTRNIECCKCGTERMLLEKNELPKNIRKFLDKTNPNWQYLYCFECDKYWIVGNPHF